jgi:hypothetical protein
LTKFIPFRAREALVILFICHGNVARSQYAEAPDAAD